MGDIIIYTRVLKYCVSWSAASWVSGRGDIGSQEESRRPGN